MIYYNYINNYNIIINIYICVCVCVYVCVYLHASKLSMLFIVEILFDNTDMSIGLDCDVSGEGALFPPDKSFGLESVIGEEERLLAEALHSLSLIHI